MISKYLSYNVLENTKACGDIVRDSSQLLYYSHIPTAGMALLIGFYILVKNKNDVLSRQLAAITFLFALWSTIDLIVWFTYNNARFLMFAWSLYGIVHILIYLFSLFFAYTFITKKTPSRTLKTLASILFLPLTLFLPTVLK